MKKKNTEQLSVHLNYLYKVASMIPRTDLSRRLCNNLIAISNKNQCKLHKIKKTICKKCSSILIPRITCNAFYSKNESGKYFQAICLNCGNSYFIFVRGIKEK